MLLDAPTIAQMTDSIRRGSVQPLPRIVPLKASGRGRPLFLVHGLGGDVLALRLLAHRIAGDRPVLGLRAQGSTRKNSHARTSRKWPRTMSRRCGGGRAAGPMHSAATPSAAWWPTRWRDGCAAPGTRKSFSASSTPISTTPASRRWSELGTICSARSPVRVAATARRTLGISPSSRKNCRP